MSQNTIVKTTPSQTLLSLNMRNINQLFPGFATGDFAVLYGSHAVSSISSLLCIRAQLPPQLGGLGSNTVFIDGANTFRLYQITRLARLHQLDPKQVLDRIYISRAFTAYQMTSLILQKLEDAVKTCNAKLVIVSDIAAMFLDKDVEDEEAKRIYSQVTTRLSNFAREHQIIIIATYPPHQENPTKQLPPNDDIRKSKRCPSPQTNKVRQRNRSGKASHLHAWLCRIALRNPALNSLHGGVAAWAKPLKPTAWL